MEETAYAKLNLALHVRAREADGYHRIETLFAFCEDGDRLTVGEGDRITLAVTGPFARELGSGDDNLVIRAAYALKDRYEVARGAALILDKRLPVASGIGGGSADAAATLRLLTRWWNLEPSEPDLLAIAPSLGADVPACLRSRTARGEGRGDELDYRAVPDLAGTPVLLVNPGVPVSTASVFRSWDGIDRGGLGDLPPPEARNDLQEPALAIAPSIAEVLAALEQSEASLVRMSGSGATCFALFADEPARDRAEARIAASHPHWWRLASRLR